jgi:hypothetical protein
MKEYFGVINKKTLLFLLLPVIFFSEVCQAKALARNRINEERDRIFRHPLYIGAIGGYGSTTWQGLVPKTINDALVFSTPVKVNEGGNIGGLFAGHEISRNFALEVSYIRYPDAVVYFDSESLFSFDHGEQTQFITKTEAFSLMGKVMFLFPGTNIRFFSSLGGASVHRRDLLIDYWRFTPTFGTGLNYHFTDYMMGEFGANYTAGFGESSLNPAESYVPFLYSVTVRLAFCF